MTARRGRFLSLGWCYFTGVAGVAGVAGLAAGVVKAVLFLWLFLTCFLVLLALASAGAALVLGVAGALGAWAANVNGMLAMANPIASKVFFMVPFLPGGPCARSQLYGAATTPESR